jgi:hypothetical protein
MTQRAALLDIYAISRDAGMPIDKILEWYLPDTSTAFKAYMVAQMRSIDKEQQQQQQQGDAAVNAAAAAAAGPPTGNGSSSAVTRVLGLRAAAGGVAAGNLPRPAAAAQRTLGSAVFCAHADGVMAQLSEVFTRLSTHMQASSKDSKEKVRVCGMSTRFRAVNVPVLSWTCCIS